MAKLIIMVGLPFSGKTTKAKQLAKEHDAIRLNTDEWHLKLFGDDAHDPQHDERHTVIEELLVELACDLLTKGTNIILDFGFWTIAERAFYSKKATELGVDFAICYCPAPEQAELLRRIEKRNSECENQSFIIPLYMYNDFIKRFQPPSEAEAHFIL